MDLESFLAKSIAEIKEKQLYRKAEFFDSSIVDFSSNDYLGLAQNQAEGIDGMLVGSAASRLITGTKEIHDELEEQIAFWKKTEAAIFYGSGYLANLGTIASLMSPKDVIFSDETNHSCIMEGIRLSGAKKFFYRHNDAEHLKELLETHREKFEKAMIISDSIFSMDGDIADIQKLVELKKEHNTFLYLDEAHASGVFGDTGGGLVEKCVEDGLIEKNDVDIQMGTFSKAIGVEGGYVAGSKLLIDFLINKSKTFIYSTAPSPIVSKLVLNNLNQAIKASELRIKLHYNIAFFRRLLERKEIQFINDKTAIFAIECQSNEEALEKAENLYNKGFLVKAIRPPTVPSPRLRICLSAKHGEIEIEDLVALL